MTLTESGQPFLSAQLRTLSADRRQSPLIVQTEGSNRFKDWPESLPEERAAIEKGEPVCSEKARILEELKEATRTQKIEYLRLLVLSRNVEPTQLQAACEILADLKGP